jgi:hypothetical protein
MECPARDRKNGMTQSNGILSLNDLIASRRDGQSMTHHPNTCVACRPTAFRKTDGIGPPPGAMRSITTRLIIVWDINQ